MTVKNKEFICIVCPEGCSISAEITEKGVKTEGNKCKRGAEYVNQEINDPRRNIASSVAVSGGVRPLVPVKTSSPIPKDKIFEVMDEIKTTVAPAPIIAGQLIIVNAAKTGCNIVATADVEAK